MEDHNQFSAAAIEKNRAFLYGDAVKAYFFIYHGRLIMSEESYFFLMASMRKLRLQIPLSFTPEYFHHLVTAEADKHAPADAVIEVMAYRDGNEARAEAEVKIALQHRFVPDLLHIRGSLRVDMIREITVGTHFLSGLRVHSVENIYAEIYARENDLDELILLNAEKRIARGISGNYLFVEGETLKIPKQSEGAYISPLLENFVTFVHKNALATISETEMLAFESQKADEILLISDEKGIFSVSEIRKKAFSNTRFSEMVSTWAATF